MPVYNFQKAPDTFSGDNMTTDWPEGIGEWQSMRKIISISSVSLLLLAPFAWPQATKTPVSRGDRVSPPAARA